jgi:hypothetical protein
VWSFGLYDMLGRVNKKTENINSPACECLVIFAYAGRLIRPHPTTQYKAAKFKPTSAM